MSKEKLRKISVKNYIILGIIVFFSIIVLYYFYLWIDVYKDSMSDLPILDKYMSVINYNELEDYLVENPNSVVYVSILENDNIRSFEKELKSMYKDDIISFDILYMNITDDIKDTNKKNLMISRYSLNNLNILSVPCVLVFDEGKLISIYSISDNDYNINKLVDYLNDISIGREDL